MEWYTGYTVIYTLKKNGGWLVVTNKRVFPATEWKVPSAGWERDPEAEVSRWATQPLLEGVEGTVETQKEGGCPLTYLQPLYTRPPPPHFTNGCSLVSTLSRPLKQTWHWRRESRRRSLKWVKHLIVQIPALPPNCQSLCLTRTLLTHKTEDGRCDLSPTYLLTPTDSPIITFFHRPYSSLLLQFKLYRACNCSLFFWFILGFSSVLVCSKSHDFYFSPFKDKHNIQLNSGKSMWWEGKKNQVLMKKNQFLSEAHTKNPTEVRESETKHFVYLIHQCRLPNVCEKLEHQNQVLFTISSYCVYPLV